MLYVWKTKVFLISKFTFNLPSKRNKERTKENLKKNKKDWYWDGYF